MLGEKTATGFLYKFQVRFQETGGAAATITQVSMVFFEGGNRVGTVNRTENIPSNQVSANGNDFSNWTITDDIAEHPFATRVQVTITFTDLVGAQSASATADVPPLPAPPQPTPPTTPTGFTLSGTVREQGGGALGDVLVVIKDTTRSTTTDGQGRYSFSGLANGSIMIRASLNGFDLLEQTVNVTGNQIVDLSMRRPPPAPAPTIDSFSADSTNLSSGQSTTIRWSVSNANSVSLDNGIGNVPSSGSRQVTPTFPVHTYRLTATGAGGTSNRSLSINVSAGPSESCTNGPYSFDSNVQRCRASNGQFAANACCGR
jgi:hypothetical protein